MWRTWRQVYFVRWFSRRKCHCSVVCNCRVVAMVVRAGLQRPARWSSEPRVNRNGKGGGSDRQRRPLLGNTYCRSMGFRIRILGRAKPRCRNRPQRKKQQQGHPSGFGLDTFDIRQGRSSSPLISRAWTCTKAFDASGSTSTSRRHAWWQGAIQHTGECAQQLHLGRRGSLIVPGADDTGRQQA